MKSLSCPTLCDPLSIGFSRQESWSGLPCSPLGHLPSPGIEPESPVSPALAGSLLLGQPGKPGMHACLVLTLYFFAWSRAGYGCPTHSHSSEAMAGWPASGCFDHDLGRFTNQGFDHSFKSSLTWFKLWPWLSGGIC